MEWHFNPGDQVVRRDLHVEYGGGTQGGISPSAKAPNVLVFSDPASGNQHGYFDGWADHKTFEYTGEGQRGDQEMIRGNAAILNHKTDGRHLRLFEGAHGSITYVGEFKTPEQAAWYWTDAPETGDGPIRQVIVFRLLPIGTFYRQDDVDNRQKLLGG